MIYLKYKYNTLQFFFLIIGIILLFCGCSSNWEADKGKTVFRYNEAAGIRSLDPAFARDQAQIWACNQLFNTLVQLDDKLMLQPSIAQRWTISEEGKEYTFTLRQDVYFHDDPLFLNGKGRKVVASDFVYSFNRIVDAKIASPGLWVFNDVEKQGSSYAFSAPNDTTFVIRLKHAFAPFLSLLSMQYCSVVPREVAEHYGLDFRNHPVGTGPFHFKMWKEGVKLVFVKNENYFEKDNQGVKLPYLDAVAITFVVDKQSAFLEFVKGNLDFLSGLDAGYKDELLTPDGELQAKYKNKFKLYSEPYLNTEYLGFLMDTTLVNTPLKVKKVRQAINYAFDRKKMMRYLRNNIGTPGIHGMIPVGLPGFDTSIRGYEYKPEKAAELLAEAGFPKGRGMGTITLNVTSSYMDICKYIQQQLINLGLDVKVEVSQAGALREMIAQSKIPWFRGSWIADYPDAENYLSLFYSKNFCPDGPNYTHFSNKAYDLLYEKARIETNNSIRYTYYQQMDNLLMEEAPVVVLYYDKVLRFTQKNIQGLGSNPMNLLTLKKVRKN